MNYVNIINKILRILNTNTSYSLDKLSRDLDIDYDLLTKIISVLENRPSNNSNKPLDKKNNLHGMLSLPLDVQTAMIKSVFINELDDDVKILMYIYKKNAIDQNSATIVPHSETLQKLIDAEYVKKTSDKYHLTENGISLAATSAELYPNLKQHNINLEPLIPMSKSNDM